MAVTCGSWTRTISHLSLETLLYSSRCAFEDLLRFICRIHSLVGMGSSCSDMGYDWGGGVLSVGTEPLLDAGGARGDSGLGKEGGGDLATGVFKC